MLEELKRAVWEANLELVRQNLVIYTWGNASGICREEGLVVIKPSGVDYRTMTETDLVVLDLDGTVVEGHWRPSSDTPTHLELYRSFPEIGGVVHTHSPRATEWAQSGRPIPCYGTTHADYFYGEIPCTRMLTESEIAKDYEGSTGKVIAEAFAGKNPCDLPAVLCKGHGPFTWGKNCAEAVYHAVVLEAVADMALETERLDSACAPLPQYLLDKHYFRKHGAKAYYGQR